MVVWVLSRLTPDDEGCLHEDIEAIYATDEAGKAASPVPKR